MVYFFIPKRESKKMKEGGGMINITYSLTVAHFFQTKQNKIENPSGEKSLLKSALKLLLFNNMERENRLRIQHQIIKKFHFWIYIRFLIISADGIISLFRVNLKKT